MRVTVRCGCEAAPGLRRARPWRRGRWCGSCLVPIGLGVAWPNGLDVEQTTRSATLMLIEILSPTAWLAPRATLRPGWRPPKRYTATGSVRLRGPRHRLWASGEHQRGARIWPVIRRVAFRPGPRRRGVAATCPSPTAPLRRRPRQARRLIAGDSSISFSPCWIASQAEPDGLAAGHLVAREPEF